MASFSTADGAHIHYEVHGEGFPVLLIAPGGMRSAISFWENTPWNPITDLQDDFQVIAMDQRNAGQSTGPVSASHGWHTYAADQLALLDHLGVDRFHVAGMKLQLLGHYYWVTRDADNFRELEPVWRSVVEFILRGRKPSHGLLEGDRYAADIAQVICSSRSNANCWRGLRDIAAVLEDMAEHDGARHLVAEAKVYREAILEAVAQSERHDSDPEMKAGHSLFWAIPQG